MPPACARNSAMPATEGSYPRFVPVDTSEATFQRDVIERSHEVPVVVDFWAEWCGPCRMLGPVIEKAVEARSGEVELVKLDTDANQRLPARYRGQSIPAGTALQDGRAGERGGR